METNHWILGLTPEAQTAAVELGHIEASEAMAAHEEYRSFSEKLDNEEIRKEVVALLRDQYPWIIGKRKVLELENREARTRGVSFATRKAIGGKLEALEGYLTETRRIGQQWAKNGQISPIQAGDMGLVQRNGMSWYLRFILIPSLSG